MSYFAPGALLAGRYAIAREIGRGGHSVVYAARDADLGTEVAIKLLVPSPATLDIARERLRREVLAVRHLIHPHIVPIYDYLTEGPWQFVVMRLVDGQDLDVTVRERGPLPVEEAVSLGSSILDALALAHREGILHRDVKPRNILIEKGGAALLTDFGSARIHTQATMTETGGVVGTLAYAAPELMAGHRADARSDVYALGLTLYFALIGRLPAQGSPNLPPAPRADGFHVRAVDPRVPGWVDRAIARATAADPGDRFPGATAFHDALAMTTVPVEPVTTWDDHCLVCGERDPEGLPVCARCRRAEQRADHLIFLEPPAHPGDASERTEQLLAWFGRAAPGASHRAVARGLQPLARVPAPLKDTALDRLAARGFAARTVPVRAAWGMIPLSLWVVALGALGLGVWAGLEVHPFLLWTSPWVAGLLVLGAGNATRTPLLDRNPRGPRLPADLERQIVTTAADLPAGTARELFAGVIRLSRFVGAGVEEERSHLGLISELVPVSCRGARELARLDEGLHLLESQTSRPGFKQADPSIRGDLELRRDRLVQRFLDAQAGLQRLLAAGGIRDAEVDGELRILTGALEQDAAAWEAAERELAL